MPSRVVAPKFLSKRSGCAPTAVSSSTSSWACVTTTIWVCPLARAISRASAGSRSACRLVSGSFSTISDGGRGLSSAATRSR